jgi:hypothetical protein
MRNVTFDEPMRRLPYPLSTSPWDAGMLLNGATYEFQLETTKGFAFGVRSNTVTVTPTVPPPPAPDDLSAVAGDGEVTLTWTPPASSTGAYIWLRNATLGEAMHRLPYPVPPPFTAEYLLNGATYEFRVQPVSGLIVGDRSDTISVRPTGPAPAAPKDLKVTSGDGKAVLRWTATPHSTGAYIWMRNVTTGEKLHRLPYAVPSPFTAGMLLNGATYEFRVQSVDGLIAGGVSAGVSVVPLGPVPAPPRDLRAVGGNGEVSLTWSAVPHATGYFIWVMDWPASAFRRLPYAVAGTSFKYGMATNGHTYYFHVQPANGLQEAECVPLSIFNESGCSNQAHATPDAPWVTLNLGNTRAQENGTYCGPTAVQATLTYFRVSASQSDLAKIMGTGSAGTMPWNMPSAFDAKLEKGRYDSVMNVDNNRLFSGVMRAIDKRYGPVIILVHSQAIPWGGGPWLEAHYLVITGYKWDDYQGGGPMYEVWDPASDEYHELRAEAWEDMAYPFASVGAWVIAPTAAGI